MFFIYGYGFDPCVGHECIDIASSMKELEWY
jgi:hypothetical protein